MRRKTTINQSINQSIMVGHTHEDIDQVFSKISTGFAKRDIPTLPNLLQAIESSKTPSPVCKHLKSILYYKATLCEALIYLLDNIYIRFGTKLYRQIVGIPMGTNCAPLVADLFLFCYERDFMTSLSGVKQAEIIEAFKSTSRYLDNLLNIDNPSFEVMVNRIYPPELQFNKANTSDTEAPFFDLHHLKFMISAMTLILI